MSPDTFTTEENTIISFNTFEKIKYSPSLFVIFPNGTEYAFHSIVPGHYNFPPSNIKNIIPGQYTAFFLNGSNHSEIAAVKFHIKSNDLLTQIHSWLKFENIIFYTPLLIPVIGFIYKTLNDNWLEKRRKFETELAEKTTESERKFNWIQKWAKDYI